MTTTRNQPLLQRITTFLGRFSCMFGFHPCVQASDLNGCWGECTRCHKRFGYVTREELRAYINRLHDRDQPIDPARDFFKMTPSQVLDHLPKKAPHIITQPLGQLRTDPLQLPVSPYWNNWISRYGGNCRECGDSGPVCPYTGLSCSSKEAQQAISHVLSAINYGLRYGYLDLTGLDPMKAEFRIPPKEPPSPQVDTDRFFNKDLGQ